MIRRLLKFKVTAEVNKEMLHRCYISVTFLMLAISLGLWGKYNQKFGLYEEREREFENYQILD
jgi:hypothetical protein